MHVNTNINNINNINNSTTTFVAAYDSLLRVLRRAVSSRTTRELTAQKERKN